MTGLYGTNVTVTCDKDHYDDDNSNSFVITCRQLTANKTNAIAGCGSWYGVQECTCNNYLDMLLIFVMRETHFTYSII